MNRDTLRNLYRATAVGTNVVVVVFLLNTTMVLSTGHISAAYAWVEHGRKVQVSIFLTAIAFLDAESNQRAYLLTRSDRYRVAYRKRLARMDGHVADLAALTADNPGQQARIAALRGLLAAKVKILDDLVAAPPAAAGDYDLSRGTELVMKARDVLVAMDAEERSLLVARQAAVADSVRRIYVGLVVILGKDLILMGIVLMAIVRERRRHHQTGGTSHVRP